MKVAKARLSDAGAPIEIVRPSGYAFVETLALAYLPAESTSFEVLGPRPSRLLPWFGSSISSHETSVASVSPALVSTTSKTRNWSLLPSVTERSTRMPRKAPDAVMRLLSGPDWFVSETGSAEAPREPSFRKSYPDAVSPYSELSPAPVPCVSRKSVPAYCRPRGSPFASVAPSVPSLATPTSSESLAYAAAESEMPADTFTLSVYVPVVTAGVPVVTLKGSYPVLPPSLTAM